MEQGLMQPQRLSQAAKLTFAWHMIDVLAKEEPLVQSADFESEEILEYLLQHHKGLASVQWFTFLAPSSLRHLSLKDCSHFSTEDLIQILDKCSELTLLSLEKCCDLDISRILKTAVHTLMSLVTLNLSNCNLNDGDVQTILRVSGNLQHLSLAETGVGDQSFLLHPKLQEEMERGETKEQTVAFRPRLVTVDLSGCSSFSNQGLHHLCSLTGASLCSVSLQRTGVDFLGLLYLVGHSQNSANRFLGNAGCMSRLAQPPQTDTFDAGNLDTFTENTTHQADSATDPKPSAASCVIDGSCVKHCTDDDVDGANTVFNSGDEDADRGLKEHKTYSRNVSDSLPGNDAEIFLEDTSCAGPSRLACSSDVSVSLESSYHNDHFNPSSLQSQNLNAQNCQSANANNCANSLSLQTDSSGGQDVTSANSQADVGTGQGVSPVCPHNLYPVTSNSVSHDSNPVSQQPDNRNGAVFDSIPTSKGTQGISMVDSSLCTAMDCEENSRRNRDSTDTCDVGLRETGSHLSLKLEQQKLEEDLGQAGLLSPLSVPEPPPPSSQSSLSLSFSSASTSALSSSATTSSPPLPSPSLSSPSLPPQPPPPSSTSLSSSLPPPSSSSPPPPSSSSLSTPSSSSSSLPPQPPPSSLSSSLSQPTPMSPSSPAEPLSPPPPLPQSPPSPPSPQQPPPPPSSPTHPEAWQPRLFHSRLKAVAFSSNIQLCHLLDQSVSLVCFKEFLRDSPCLRELRLLFEPKICDERMRPLISSSPLFGAFICQAVEAVGDVLPGVEHLVMNQEEEDINMNHVTDSLVKHLLERCTDLVSLDLTGCYLLSDAAFYPLQNFESLRRLHISTASITLSSYCFQHCTPFSQLSSLDLSWCEEINSNSLDQALSACECVTSLRLRSCPVSNHTLAVIAERCRALVTLDIASAEDLEDFSVVALVKALPRLTLLNLAYNCGLSDVSVHAVLQYCPLLEMLDLSCLHLVTDKPFLPIIRGISWEDWLTEYAIHQAHMNSGMKKKDFLHRDRKMWIPRRSTSYASCLREVNLSYCTEVKDEAMRVVVTVGRCGLAVYGYHQQAILPLFILTSADKLWVQLEDWRGMF